jgi:YidC/Oxa1 family membrane protein insertase
MQLKTGENQFLEYRYVMKENDHMLEFSIRTQGLENVLNTSKPSDLEWNLKTYRNEKSVSYENRYTEIAYEFEDGKDSYLSSATDDEDTIEEVTYVAFKQHFFTSVLLTSTPFKTTEFKSDNLVDDDKKDTIFTKNFTAKMPLEFKNGALNYDMNMYYGPTDYKTLSAYDKNLDEFVCFHSIIWIVIRLYALRSCNYYFYNNYQNCDVAYHIQIILVTSKNEGIKTRNCRIG